MITLPCPWAFPATFLLLLVLGMLYIRLAVRHGVVAHVSWRSSATHLRPTATGGGVIFVAALIPAVIYTLACRGAGASWSPTVTVMLAGSLPLAAVSFIDDFRSVNVNLRLWLQVIVISATCAILTGAAPIIVTSFMPWWVLAIIFTVVGVGFVNAYNFMDGITGMLALYSIVALSSLCYVLTGAGAACSGVCGMLLMAALAFAILNMKPSNAVFSGDVGSITLGYLLFCLLLAAIAAMHDPFYVVFFAVYGVDTVYTLFQRLFKGENILTSHRRHLYQMLAHHGCPDLAVSGAYSLVQLAVNIGFIATPPAWHGFYAAATIILLSIIYFPLKHAFARS